MMLLCGASLHTAPVVRQFMKTYSITGSSTEHYTTHPPTLVSLLSNSRHMSEGSIEFTSGFSILKGKHLEIWRQHLYAL